MKLRLILAFAFLTSTQAATNWTVYLRRVGPIRIGMTLAEVRRVIGDANATTVNSDPATPLVACSYLDSPAHPKGLGFMFMYGRVVRIDVYEPGIFTASGVQVGDTEERIKSVYKDRITVEPHHYLFENGHYLNYEPKSKSDLGYGIVFETDGEKVNQYRVGTLKAIALVEACS